MTTDSTHTHATQSTTTWKRPNGFGLFEAVRAFLLGTALIAPIAAVGAGIMYYDYAGWTEALAARERQQGSLERLLAAAPLEVLPVAAVQHGHNLYATSCAACHSPTGKGVPGLGQDLVHSWFIASLDDADLKAFIRNGRPANAPDNTTGIPMPPMGGHDLSDDELNDLVAYMRILQDPRRLAEGTILAAAPPAQPTADQNEMFLSAAGGDADLAAYIASGAALYAASCAACHGPGGSGIAGLGTKLRNNPFCLENDEEFLLDFVKRGRDPSHPDNVTGIAMPPKGGNPALDDDDILDIIEYIRALQHLTTTQR